jgi:hypothetical protein
MSAEGRVDSAQVNWLLSVRLWSACAEELLLPEGPAPKGQVEPTSGTCATSPLPTGGSERSHQSGASAFAQLNDKHFGKRK